MSDADAKKEERLKKLHQLRLKSVIKNKLKLIICLF